MNWIKNLEVLEKGEIVENPHTKQSCYLVPLAVAILDAIKGAELLLSVEYNKEREKRFQQGLAYFREHWPAEYMILLD